MSTNQLNVAHVAPCTPGQCGLYETMRELVFAERRLGVNAHVVDPRPYEHELAGELEKAKAAGQHTSDLTARPGDWAEDRGTCIAPVKWALERADVVVSHGGLTDKWKDCAKPRIHLAHGRPNSSYRIEQLGESNILTTYRQMADDPRWRRLVTLWPGFEHYWRLYFPRVEVIQCWADLDFWRPAPAGAKPYDFGGKAGAVNVVATDIWRMDKDPFHACHAFRLFAEREPGAKLHVYGVPQGQGAWRPVLNCLAERKALGEVSTLAPPARIREVYRAATAFITPHKMATRTVREALACGAQVVADVGNPYTPYTADAEDLPACAKALADAAADWRERQAECRAANRGVAEKNFDLGRAAEEFISLIDRVRAEGIS